VLQENYRTDSTQPGCCSPFHQTAINQTPAINAPLSAARKCLLTLCENTSLKPFLQAQQDTSGLAIVLLTALAEKQWVEEDVLARDLNLPPKMVRKAMRYFEQVRCGCCSSCVRQITSDCEQAGCGWCSSFAFKKAVTRTWG
jgi:hypothetical protein